MKVFISGGCKNGKSTYAERIAVALSQRPKPLYYIATMRPMDSEDRARIQRHRFNRKDLGFHTIEMESDILDIANSCNKNGTFLLDSTTALLANEMFTKDGAIHKDADEKVGRELETVISELNNIVIVSDYIYSDVVLYDDLTKNYCRGLGHIDRICARNCDVVIEVCYGNMVLHKGAEVFNESYQQNI